MWTRFFVARFRDGGKKMYDKNYELLADAIIVQAAKDYRRSKSVLVRNEIKCFFLSEWFACLTNADGHKLFRKLERERDGKKKHRGKEVYDVSIQN